MPLFLLLIPFSLAATRVFVEPLRSTDAALGAQVTAQLVAELRSNADWEIVTVDDVPLMQGDQPARLYLASCRSDEPVGCVRIVADAGNAAYAVAGAVVPKGDETTLNMVLLEVVANRRVHPEHPLDLVGTSNDLPRLLWGIHTELDDYMSGRLDVALEAEDDVDDAPDRPRDATELRDLDADEALASDIGRGVHQSRRSSASLDAERARRQENGRKGQVLLRLDGGFTRGPVDGLYYGRLLLEDDLTTTLDVAAWQTAETGLGAVVGGGLGFGISPTMELTADAAWMGGHYDVDAGEQIGEDGDPAETAVETTRNGTLLVTAGLRVAPYPTLRTRPVFTVGPAWVRGSSVLRHSDMAFVNFPPFSAPSRFGVELSAGAEVRMGERADAFARIPILLLLGDGTTVEEDGVEILEDTLAPPDAASLGVGIQVGIQGRVGR